MAKSVSDFEVMLEMSRQNLDIRMSGTSKGGRTVKGGGVIEMMVDSGTLQEVLKGMALGQQKHYTALYVANVEQFEKIKKELNSKSEPDYKQLFEEIAQRLDDGRHYLMGVDPKKLTVEDALEAFGYNRNGF
jgi:hypothetical protein